VIELTQQELQRLKVIENAVMGRIAVPEASRLLDISGRQTFFRCNNRPGLR